MKIECPNSLKVDKIRDGIMFFRASSKPRTSNHGIPLIFFKKKENVLAYLSNTVEQICTGVSGYIYHVNEIIDSEFELQIPYAVTSSAAVEGSMVAWISDAYAAILKAEEMEDIVIERFSDVSGKKKEWIKKMI